MVKLELKERLEEIEKHFETISDEKFNDNLINAGYGVIKPLFKSEEDKL